MPGQKADVPDWYAVFCWGRGGGDSFAKLYCLATSLTVFSRALLLSESHGVLAPPFSLFLVYMYIMLTFLCFKVHSYFSQTRKEPTRTVSLLRLPGPL
jgi:hypothetical protein